MAFDRPPSSTPAHLRARARRRPDAWHPFGYGAELFYWSLLAAVVSLMPVVAVGPPPEPTPWDRDYWLRRFPDDEQA